MVDPALRFCRLQEKGGLCKLLVKIIGAILKALRPFATAQEEGRPCERAVHL